MYCSVTGSGKNSPGLSEIQYFVNTGMTLRVSVNRDKKKMLLRQLVWQEVREGRMNIMLRALLFIIFSAKVYVCTTTIVIFGLQARQNR